MTKVDSGPKARGRKACCLVSEMLEEMGLNSSKARAIRRQTLVGLITFCQWQLSRIDESESGDTFGPGEPRKTRGRRVRVV